MTNHPMLPGEPAAEAPPAGAEPGTAEPRTAEPRTAEPADTTPTDAEPASLAPDRLRERWGWLGVAALTAAVAASWAPYLTDPLGDNQAGRITGRYAIQLRNLQEKGLLDSHWGADWSPYSADPYAHHPPLRNMLDALFGSLPGDGVYQLRIAPYLLALLAIPAAAAMLRAFRIGWVPTLLAVGLMVVTGYYWIYAPVRYDLGIILALAAMVLIVRSRPRPSHGLVAATCLAALMATLQSWPSIAFAAALGLWLFAARRLDRVTVAVGASMLAGVAISAAYIVGVSGPGSLASRTGVRTTVDATVADFLARQWHFLTTLLPAWYLVLLPIAVVAGLANRRTRLPMAVATVFATAWVVVLNNGSYVHDYWGFLVLIPGVIGMGALGDWSLRRTGGRPNWRAIAAAATAALILLLGLGFGTMVFGETAQRYLIRPAAAGQLALDNPPAEGQRYAWYSRIAAPRWLAYHWDLDPSPVNPTRLAEEAQPQDLVLLDLDRLPVWLPESIASRAVEREGQYAVFRAADLLAAAEREER